MNQKLLKKLPRYCAVALICAMMSAASALAFNEIPSPGNLTGSGTIGGNSLKVSASSASAVVVGGESNTASGLYSVAIGGISNSAFWRGSVAVGGYENNASGLYSVAVGGLTNTVGYVSVAVGGYENNASGFYSVAVGGRTNTVSGYHSVVVGGRSNSASSNYSVAIGGYMNTASEDSSLAAGGLHNTASGNWSAAFGGSMNTASGGHSVAVGGQLNSASGDGSAAFGGARNTAFGYWAAAFGGEYNIASGESSATLGGKSGDASGKYSVAVGGLYNTASAQYSAALGGAGNTAKGKNSVVIGGGIGDGYGGVPVSGDNTASGPGSVILGGTNNVTTAAASQSVVVGGKGGQASEEYAAVLGGLRNAASGKNSVATGGFYNLAYGTNSAVFGGSVNLAYGRNSAVFGGQNNTASGDNSAVLGGIANTAAGEYSAAVGGNANKATGGVSAAVGGYRNTASGFRSTAVGGYLNTASGVESVTLGGEGGQAAEEYAVAIGGGQANAKNSVAIGNGVKTSTTQNEVAIGNSDANKLTFTGANIAASGQKITNVAAGMNDSDVVVVSQLKKVSSDAKLYTDKKAAEALTAANNYTDTEVKKAITASTYTGTENIEVDNDKRTIALKDNVKLTDAGSLKVGEKTTVDNKGVLYTAADGEKVLLGEDAGGTKGLGIVGKTADGAFVHTAVVSAGIGVVKQTADRYEHTDMTQNAFGAVAKTANSYDHSIMTPNSVEVVSTTKAGAELAFMTPKSIAVMASADGVAKQETEITASGVYVTDSVNNKNSALTTDTLKVGSKTYIDDNGVNANDGKITNVAAGEADTDAVNVAQLKAAQKGATVLGSENITVTPTADGQKVSLKDNVQLTKNGTVTIGTEDDIAQIIIGATSPLGTKGIKSSYKTADGKENSAGIDSIGFDAESFENGEVKLATRHSADYLQFADATESGVHKASGFTADRLGIEVSQDGKISYGSGLTAKGLEVADLTDSGEQKMAGLAADKLALAISKDGKVVQGNGISAKGMEVIEQTEEGNIFGALVDAKRMALAVSKDGDLVQANGISAKGMEVLEKTEDGKIVGATVNTQAIGIAVSKDNKLSYGTGVTAKGIEVADNSAEDINKAAQISTEDIAVIETDKEGNGKRGAGVRAGALVAFTGSFNSPDKIVSITTGKTMYGQEYAAGLYIDDATKKEMSSLTTDTLTVANKAYITKDGVNANNGKITNVAEGTAATDAANVGQLITVTAGSNVTLNETTNANGSKNYEINAIGAGFLEGGDNINVTDGKINLEDNIQLTKDGTVTIGTEEDDRQMLIGAETPIGTKGIINKAKTDDGKVNYTEIDSKEFIAQVIENGEVKHASRLDSSVLEFADAATPGQQKLTGLTVDRLGIAVSQDGGISYGTGITPKGVVVDDTTTEGVTEVSTIGKQGFLTTYGSNGASIDKAAFVTTGGEFDGQKYEAGLYVGDKTKNEISSLTTDKLTVANKTYIDKNGINANDQKIINVANGTIAQNSKDAVNGGQLWDAYNRMFDMDNRINDVYNDVSGVGSQAAAMSALQAIPYNPYAPTTVTAGLGFYRSDQAVAVGIYHYIRDTVLLNVGGAFNLNGHGDAMGRAGISFALGKGAGKGGVSVGRDLIAMQSKMDAMQNKIDALESENKENKQIIAENQKTMAENMKLIESLKKALEEKNK